MGNSWLFIFPLFFSPYAIALNRVARLAKPVKQIYFYFALLLELLFLTKHTRVEAMLFINNVTFFWDTLFLVLAKSPFFFLLKEQSCIRDSFFLPKLWNTTISQIMKPYAFTLPLSSSKKSTSKGFLMKCYSWQELKIWSILSPLFKVLETVYQSSFIS